MDENLKLALELMRAARQKLPLSVEVVGRSYFDAQERVLRMLAERIAGGGNGN